MPTLVFNHFLQWTSTQFVHFRKYSEQCLSSGDCRLHLSFSNTGSNFEGALLSLPARLCPASRRFAPLCSARRTPAGSRGPRPADRTPPSPIDRWRNNRAAVQPQEEAQTDRRGLTGPHGFKLGIKIVQIHSLLFLQQWGGVVSENSWRCGPE